MLWWRIVRELTITSAHDNVNRRLWRCKLLARASGGGWWVVYGGGGVWWRWCVLGGPKILVPPQYGQKHVSGRSRHQSHFR